jgi:hypothetical protein
MRDLLDLLEAANPQINNYLQQMGHETKITGNKLVVLAQVPEKNKNKHRQQLQQDILNSLKKIYPGVTISTDISSSIGAITFPNDPTRILVKDIGVQGDQSAGVGNELEIAKLIESVIEKYGSANVSFVDPRGMTLSLENVTTVETTGKQVKDKETGQSKKADIVLKSGDRKLPISIKQVNAESWESADSSFGRRARGIVIDLNAKGLITLDKIDDQNYKISREIVVEPTEEEAIKAIFGGDLNPEGGIVIQTFKPEHFVQEGNNVTVQCHAVIKSKSDIPDSHLMVWLIRNQKGRLSKALGIRGLRVQGSTLQRAIGRSGDKDVVLVDKDGNVVERPAAAEPAQELVPPGSEGPEFARSTVKAGGTKPEKVGTNKSLGRKRR